MFTIRPHRFDDADFHAQLDIHRVLWPEYPFSMAEYRHTIESAVANPDFLAAISRSKMKAARSSPSVTAANRQPRTAPVPTGSTSACIRHTSAGVSGGRHMTIW